MGVRAGRLVLVGFGLSAAWVGCTGDTSPARNLQTSMVGGPPGGAASSESSGSGGVDPGVGGPAAGDGNPQGGGGTQVGGGGMTGVSGTGPTMVGMPIGGFDAGTDPGRNAVTPGMICDRLASIQCAGEAACCSNPGRDFASCKQTMMAGCSSQYMADSIAGQPAAGFDAAQAQMVFAHFEDLASQCDSSIAAFAESPQGLRSVFKGTVAPMKSCRPASVTDMAMAGGALAACTNGDSYACMPSLVTWICNPRAAAGGQCFTDINCKQGLFCNNPKLDIAGSTCMPRKQAGTSCISQTNARTCIARAAAAWPQANK